MDQLDNLENFITNIDQILANAFNANSTTFNKLQKDQLQTGNNSDGKRRKAYSATYKRVRSAKGLQTQNVDLKFTGNMYKKITSKADLEGIEITFGTEYAKYLEKRYGDGIFGLDEDKQKEFFLDLISNELNKRL